MADGTSYVLVTGGAGYIGSHTVLELLKEGYSIIVLDNLSNAAKGVNSIPESLSRVRNIVGGEIKLVFYEVDMLNVEELRNIFKKHKIQSVIHLAAKKAVGESVEKPLLYYSVNVTGTLNLLNVMKEFKVRNMAFSSSATVYGTPRKLPIDELEPTGNITNPYGRSKFIVEMILKDLYQSTEDWNIILLRYFNPIGAHESGQIGEDPSGPPNNLMPYATQVAVGKREELKVFGNDYDTPDGTGVRDYIHVVDLAIGHVAAIKKLEENCGLKVYNLGTGTGYSVFDIIKGLEKAAGRKINYSIVGRREGDVASVYADSSLAEKELGWKAVRGLDKMCEDHWRWQSQNPNGYTL
ncbi:UDP-glucose 4-epimerase-like [Acanthaster planci]|uniref:UDP-glucose 4-epimerase n=1 Tax=Acanthaster planci TaxID=133434 RepID=A0A8B7YK49_ACAPL|nr:UDP-glucose 4-epimerase-like [Acanthaster planci]XP_022093646.1 UDP-glucose 4-epimerase-like [Acanthaster planci]